mmetsp:Transcript_30526/g.99224  ORF Transcript_30526/g.99224 Transcript_30526/m.99224 type:complete len:237 (+) Transcript_30526:1338-2048(+)
MRVATRRPAPLARLARAAAAPAELRPSSAISQRSRQRLGSISTSPARKAAAALALPRSPGRKISSTPGRRSAFFTLSSTVCTRPSKASPIPSIFGSTAHTRLPQFFSSILSVMAAPTSEPARSSTTSERALPLCPLSNTVMAPPSIAAFGSVVMLPALSIATPSGMGLPAVRASSRPKNAYADVAMSITIGWSGVGMPTQIGLVPSTACFAPCGATNSGDCASTSAMYPCSEMELA